MDVIWNLTRICPWDCAICCVTAIHACETTRHYLKSQQRDYGKELSLAEKMQVLRDLCDEDCNIDFSGGDPLYYDEDRQVVEQATIWLPEDKINVSMTGVELTKRKIELLKKVKDVEFTIDSPSDAKNFARPIGFHLSSVMALKECVEAGIKTRAVTVLYPLTMRESNLREVYKILCELGVREWELLRFYPVGRARHYFRLTPSRDDYLKTMAFLRTLRGPTKIFFQHSLRMLEEDGVCPAVNQAVGILPDGSVSACAWAINTQVKPINKCFMLGKMPEQKFHNIIVAAKNRAEFQNEAHESRIITWLKEHKTPRKE
jgi:MoaA/NifB/PqqE/SkfB family radical SAM enzyme